MKLTIRNKLTGGFASVLVLAVAVGAIALLGFNSVQDNADLTVSGLLEYKDINRQINIAMLQARRSEKDFFLRGDPKYVDKVETAIDDIHTLSEAVKGLDLKQENFDKSEQINELADEYNTTFLKVVDDTEKKGSGDLGIVGKFRAKVHQIEGIVVEANALQLQVDMLTLRRHEKDYLLRGDEKYVSRINESVIVFQDHIKKANLDKLTTDLLNTEVLEYRDMFLEVVAIEHLISENTEIFREVVHTIEPLIEENVAAAALLATSAVDNLHSNISSSTTLILISLLVAIALGTVLSFLLSRSITNPINTVVAMIKDVAEGEGDLTKRLEVTSNDEIGELSTWFNTFMGKLHDIISQVKANAIEVSSAATEIASAAEQASAGANEQTAQTGEVATSVEQMTATILESAQNAGQATESAKQAAEVATEGGTVVQQTIEGMTAIASSVSASAVTIGELGKRSDEIGEIIEVIDDIADQTNLLALNAAIEAARAGEQGRGFAVVADEVRKLAERTTKATAEIASMIKGIQEETGGAVTSMEEASRQVEDGTELAAKAGDSLSQIVSVVAEVQNMVEQIATASDEQSAAAEQISGNVAGISSVSQQTAQGAEQIATASEQLNRQTEALDNLVGQFKLAENKTLEQA